MVIGQRFIVWEDLVLDATKPTLRREEEAANEMNLPSSKFSKTRPVNRAPVSPPAPRLDLGARDRRVHHATKGHEIARLRRRGEWEALAVVVLAGLAYLIWGPTH